MSKTVCAASVETVTGKILCSIEAASQERWWEIADAYRELIDSGAFDGAGAVQLIFAVTDFERPPYENERPWGESRSGI